MKETLTKDQWYKALDKKYRAALLVDGPVEVKFNKGNVTLVVDIQNLKDEKGYITGDLNYATIVEPKENTDYNDLINEMIETVSPSRSMRGIQWKMFGTTRKDLAKAAIAKARKNK